MSVAKSADCPISVPQQIISSCSGALLTSFFVTPMDVVKIRLQAQQKPVKPGGVVIHHNTGILNEPCLYSPINKEGPKGATPAAATNGSCGMSGNGVNGNGISGINANGLSQKAEALRGAYIFRPWLHTESVHFSGTWDAVIKISRSEGIAALWSGLSPTLIMSIPATVLYFTTYDRLKYALGYDEKNPSTAKIPIVAGMISRTLTTTVISPLELLRTKMQSETVSVVDLRQAVRATLRDCGPLILMRGLGPSLLRDVPFSGLYWYGYEYFKAWQMLTDGNVDGPPTFLQSFKAGAASGTIAAVVTLPFDVIKTHRQIELGKANFCKDTKLITSYSLLKKLYAEKGLAGPFAGIVPRIIKVTPACAIMISSYEYGKAYFRTHNLKKHIKQEHPYRKQEQSLRKPEKSLSTSTNVSPK